MLVAAAIFGNHRAVFEPAAAPLSPPLASLPAWRGSGGGLRAAIMLLTRLPTGRGESSPAARRWACGWFPLVGALIGSLCAATQLGLARLLGPHLGAVATVVVGVLLTGALHEDGLGDTADALGGARDRAHIFVILKDSRHGTYGVLALVLVVLLRVGAIDELGAHAPAALILGALVSRTAMVALLAALPYVTPADVARSADVAQAGWPQIALATVLCAGGCAAVGATGALPWGALGSALGAAGVTTLVAGWRFAVRAGGITGDFLGAGQQISEISALAALIALLR